MLEDRNYLDLTKVTSGGGGEGGVTDHADLTGRSKSSQHPISAITNLQTTLDNNIGRFVSLGFDGTLASGTLTFAPPSGTDPYTISENHEYELDLSFQVAGTVDDTVEVVIENDSIAIQFYAVTHNDVSTPITWADFKNLATYDDTNGYRWLIRAGFHTTTSGVSCFVIYPTISKQKTETWTFTLSDGTTIEKQVCVGV